MMQLTDGRQQMAILLAHLVSLTVKVGLKLPDLNKSKLYKYIRTALHAEHKL